MRAISTRKDQKITLGDTTTSLDSVDESETLLGELSTSSNETNLLDVKLLADLLVVLADVDGLKAGSKGTEERDLDVVGVVVRAVDLGGEVEERGDGSSGHGALHGSLGGLLELADIVRVAVDGAGGGEDEATSGNGLVGDDGEGAAEGLVDGGVRGDRGEGGEEDGADGGVDGDDGVVLGGGGEVGLGGSDDLWQGEHGKGVCGVCVQERKENKEARFFLCKFCFSRPVSGWKMRAGGTEGEEGEHKVSWSSGSWGRMEAVFAMKMLFGDAHNSF